MLVGRWFAGTPIIDAPPMRTCPDDTSSNPAIVRNNVVFPHPDGPRREKNSPCPTSRLMSRSAW